MRNEREKNKFYKLGFAEYEKPDGSYAKQYKGIKSFFEYFKIKE